ncbi:MAG: winged helix DNA-binding domain-containing protein [Chloroflexaceae bacterium]
MVTLNWNQVNTWRLAQQHLLERAERRQMLDVVTNLGGVQAQLMSAAELSLWARVQDLTPAAVREALWETRTLVKTWAMRGTLHLLPTHAFPLYVAAFSTFRHYRRASRLKYHGLTNDELEALLAGVRATLSDTGITREQLADAIAERTATPKLRELLRSGWGALLKPSAFRGDLCFGPGQGQQVTFVQPTRWLGEQPEVAADAALPTLLRRYLTAYGPATPDEFARWSGLEAAVAKRLFRESGDELTAVRVADWSAWALTATLESLQNLQPSSGCIRLLPHFDVYTIAVARHSQYLLPPAQRKRVYRAQGWISPVVLVDGRIAGVWEYDRQRAPVPITVSLFAPPTEQIHQGIADEAARLGQFLEAEVALTVQHDDGG